MSAYILDTETTGIEDADVVELAWLRVSLGQSNLVVDDEFQEYFCPSRPMELGALATHHILPHTLLDRRPSSMAMIPEDAEYLIGHNIDFDWKMLGSPSQIKRIDTLCLARQWHPEWKAHNLTACMYGAFGATEEMRDALRNAHSALHDVTLCFQLLEQWLFEHQSVTTMEQIWAASEDARIPSIMPFGKFRGEPIHAVDNGYRSWYHKQADTDPYILMAFGRYPYRR